MTDGTQKNSTRSMQSADKALMAEAHLMTDQGSNDSLGMLGVKERLAFRTSN